MALVVLFTMLVPSVVAADPLVDSPADVVAGAGGWLNVFPSGTTCPDDGQVREARAGDATLGSGDDYTGLLLELDLSGGFYSTEGAGDTDPFTLCGEVKPTAGEDSADCREFAATLRGTREMHHLIAGEDIVDVFEAELTAIGGPLWTTTVWSLTSTYTRYREDGTATGETGELYLAGWANPLGEVASCDWWALNLLGHGYELSETSG